MIAAIYARKSTDQAGAGDKSDSIERQLEHSRMYAAREGWAVADEHVYIDDGSPAPSSSNVRASSDS